MIQQNKISKPYLFNDFNDVYNNIWSALQHHETYLLLIGESGAGKTTLLRYLIGNLDSNLFQSVYLCGRQTSASSMMGTLAKHFHLPSWCTRIEMLHLLTTAIRNLSARFIVIVDDAQELPDQIMTELRLLCEAQLQNEPLFTVLLSSLPSLKERLLSVEHTALLRRIATRLRLRGLQDEEVEQYLNHCCDPQEIRRFSQQALSVLFEHAHGLPAQILQYTTFCLQNIVTQQAIDKQQVLDCIQTMESF